MGSRLVPLSLTAAALAAGAAGLQQVALYLGLLAVPFAAAAAFVAVSDALERKPASLLRAVTSGLALVLVVTASASRYGTPHGAGTPPLATWALFLALVVYVVPTVAWLLEPLRLPATRGGDRLEAARKAA